LYIIPHGKEEKGNINKGLNIRRRKKRRRKKRRRRRCL
jgi:hypothetical protein